MKQKLSNVYTLPLGEIVEKHNMSCMFFAGDGNLYLGFRQNKVDPAKASMEDLARDLKYFFVENAMMSNDNKLIAMVINGTHCEPIIFPPLSVGNVEVPISLSAQNAWCTP